MQQLGEENCGRSNELTSGECWWMLGVKETLIRVSFTPNIPARFFLKEEPCGEIESAMGILREKNYVMIACMMTKCSNSTENC